MQKPPNGGASIDPLPGLHRLRAFVVLAEERDLRDAAERLRVTPSSLSRLVKKLEDELHAVLFERSRRRVELTATGERLLPAARGVIDSAARLVADLRAVPDTSADELSKRRVRRAGGPC
ncbi:MAG TPA: LysR family transcriptional regulator [Candidatus Elarobacter sp.]|nr:LysR family transcriptional regulator [Candidatus Elarobacter sp.]